MHLPARNEFIGLIYNVLRNTDPYIIWTRHQTRHTDSNGRDKHIIKYDDADDDDDDDDVDAAAYMNSNCNATNRLNCCRCRTN